MTSPEKTSMEPAAYQHSARPAWGAAVIAWEHEDKRGYLFEDGQIRVLKSGYFHLMVETDVSVERFSELLDMARRVTANNTPTSTSARRGISVDEQLDFFLGSFPGGFTDEGWLTEHRADEGRTRKRHRDATIERAAVTLASEELDAAIAGDVAKGITKVSKLFNSTDLVPAAPARGLASCDTAVATQVLTALRDLLWSSEPINGRFEAWVTALTAAGQTPPTWMMATAPLAIVYPKEHVCVRPTPFRAQATSLAPRLRLTGTPHAALYDRALGMATRVRDRLIERGTTPTDFLDVHDFIRFTLSPSSGKAILAARG